MTSLKPAKKNFFLKDKAPEVPVTEFEKKEHRPTSSARWTDHLARPFSAREIRRQRERDTKSTTKKHRRHQISAFHQSKSYREIAAVRVLEHIEQVERGLHPGGLRLQLIKDDLLPATRNRIVGWVDTVIDGEDAKRPITIQVDRGHTPHEILSVVLKDVDKDIARIYTELVEEEQQAAEIRRAERRQAAQAKREAAVSA